jgi:molecular chaperone DnaK (HSP70)
MIQDVISHGLGVVAGKGNNSNELENSIIIKRNTTIPAHEKRVYGTSVDNQQGIHLQLTEGDEEDLKYVTMLGDTMIKLKNMLPEGYPITIEIAVDSNGIVHVYAYEGAEEYGYPLVKLGEMEVKRKVYGEKIEHFESEADLILNSQSQINAVMTKFKQMDLLVEDLESRTDAVRHLQDWLIRAETRMENMKTDLQRVLPEEKPVVVEASDNLGESIRELYRQGMSAADIAKIVGTSLEEVEFAVELEEVLSSKR